MCWESFAVVRFDLGPLVQGQTAVAKLKSAHISLIISPRGLECENYLFHIRPVRAGYNIHYTFVVCRCTLYTFHFNKCNVQQIESCWRHGVSPQPGETDIQ